MEIKKDKKQFEFSGSVSYKLERNPWTLWFTWRKIKAKSVQLYYRKKGTNTKFAKLVDPLNIDGDYTIPKFIFEFNKTKVAEHAVGVTIVNDKLPAGDYEIKAVANYSDSKSDENHEEVFVIRDLSFSRPITLTFNEIENNDDFVRKPPIGGKVGVIPEPDNISEVADLYVTVPLYDTEEEYWGGIEILIDDQPSAKVTPNTEEPIIDDTEAKTRTFQFKYDYSERPEGPVKLTARYKNDPGSFHTRTNRVVFAEFWEDFETASINYNMKKSKGKSGNTKGTWNEGFMGSFPHKYHYTVSTPEDAGEAGNKVLSAFSFDNSSLNAEINSPTFKVPDTPDKETFLTFNYKRDIRVFDGTSEVLAQMYNELAQSINPLGGPILPGTFSEAYLHNTGRGWSISAIGVNGSAGKTIYGSSSQSLTPGYFSLNIPNYVEANIGYDKAWQRKLLWLTPPSEKSNFAGETISLKIKQWYGEGQYYDPSTEETTWHGRSNPTIHYFDNFRAVTYNKVNLPPTIDNIQTEDEQFIVVQNSEVQEVKLSGITDGEKWSQDQLYGAKGEILTYDSFVKNYRFAELLDVELTKKQQIKAKILAVDLEATKILQKKIDESKIRQMPEKFAELTVPLNWLKPNSSKAGTRNLLITHSCDNEDLFESIEVGLDDFPEGSYVTTGFLRFKPAENKTGEATIFITLDDQAGNAHNGQNEFTIPFKVKVEPYSAPYLENPFTPLVLTEDFGSNGSISLDYHFKDKENDEITYTISYDQSVINCELNDSSLTINSLPDAYGDGSIAITATDDKFWNGSELITEAGKGQSVTETWSITVNSDGTDWSWDDPNDPDDPLEIHLPKNFAPDSVIVLKNLFTSESSQMPKFSVSPENSSVLKADVTGEDTTQVLVLSSIPEAVGSVKLALDADFDRKSGYSKSLRKMSLRGTKQSQNKKKNQTAISKDDEDSDDTDPALKGSGSYYYKIIVGNNKPELIKEFADLDFKANFKDSLFNLSEYFYDANHDYLSYDLSYDSTKVKAYITYDDYESSGMLVLESIANASGSTEFVITASDNEYSVSDTFKLDIAAGTSVAYLTKAIADTVTTEDFSDIIIDLSKHFADPTGNPINYSINGSFWNIMVAY